MFKEVISKKWNEELVIRHMQSLNLKTKGNMHVGTGDGCNTLKIVLKKLKFDNHVLGFWVIFWLDFYLYFLR